MILIYDFPSATDIELPIVFGSDSVVINWGDGSTETFSSGPVTHSYSITGRVTITITGRAVGYGRLYKGAEYLKEVTQWGDLGLTSLAGAFMLAISLVSVPSTLPTTVTDMSDMFYYAGPLIKILAPGIQAR